MLDVDEHRYTKACATERIRPIGKLLWRSGACSLYLDYQVWRAHFWWWHPFTWLMVIGSLLVFGISNWEDVRDELFVPKHLRKYPYRRAPLR